MAARVDRRHPQKQMIEQHHSRWQDFPNYEGEIQFMSSDGRTLSQIIAECHSTALAKGWWEGGDRNFGELIALCHSELSEALEEYRKHGLDPAKFLYTEGDSPKPEGIASELADVLVRVFDFSARYGIPLEAALFDKMAFNRTRPHRHGGKKA